MLQGKDVSVNISDAVFESFETGVRYVIAVVIRNTSLRGQRIRIVPPRLPVFNLEVQNDVEIAPGLDLHAELSFLSSEYKDFEDQFIVSIGRTSGQGDEQLTIPVRALQPAADLRFPTELDFGASSLHSHLLLSLPCPPYPLRLTGQRSPGRTPRSSWAAGKVVSGTTEMVHLVVQNKGQRDGKVVVQPVPPGGAKFNILPKEATVKAGASASLKVDFSATDLGVSSLKVANEGWRMRGSE